MIVAFLDWISDRLLFSLISVFHSLTPLLSFCFPPSLSLSLSLPFPFLSLPLSPLSQSLLLLLSHSISVCPFIFFHSAYVCIIYILANGTENRKRSRFESGICNQLPPPSQYPTPPPPGRQPSLTVRQPAISALH